MVGLGAGVGLRAHNINKTVVAVYNEKSHPNMYAIMAMLIPNI